MSKTIHMLPCPTCAEQVTGTTWQDYIAHGSTTIFSPSVYYSWDGVSLPALFMNANANHPANKKPKWTLVQGVAPSTLELDSSRSGRLYKPSLRAFLDPPVRALPFDRRMEKEGRVKEGKQRVDGFLEKHSLLSSFLDSVHVCEMCGLQAKNKHTEKEEDSDIHRNAACEQRHMHMTGPAARNERGKELGGKGKGAGERQPQEHRVLFLTPLDYERVYDALVHSNPTCINFEGVRARAPTLSDMSAKF